MREKGSVLGVAANLSLLGEDRPPFPPSLPFVRIKDAKEDLFSHILKLAPLSPPLRTPRRSVCKRKKFPPRMTSSELGGTRVLSPSPFSRIPRRESILHLGDKAEYIPPNRDCPRHFRNIILNRALQSLETGF